MTKHRTQPHISATQARGSATQDKLPRWRRPFALRTLPILALEAAYARALARLSGELAELGPGLRRAVRRLERIAAALGLVEQWNARVRRKRAMLDDPGWRARVRKTLGGDAALLRWERQADARQAAGEAAPRPIAIARAPARTKTPSSQRVRAARPDFELAPLPRARSAKGAAPARKPGLAPLGSVSGPVSDTPIPVWPTELRWRTERRRATSKRAVSHAHIAPVRITPRPLPSCAEFGAPVERVLGLACEPV